MGTVVTYLFAGEHPLSTMRLTPTLLTVIAIITCSFCDFGDHTSDNVKTHRQVLSLDTSAVYEGVLKPENIAIHVAQNFVNFVSSTLAWSFLLHLYQGTSRSEARVKRETDERITQVLENVAESFQLLMEMNHS